MTWCVSNPDNPETLDDLIKRDVVKFEPADLLPDAKAEALDSLRAEFDAHPAQVPYRGLLVMLLVIAVARPLNIFDVRGHVDYSSDMIQWRYHGYQKDWNLIVCDWSTVSYRLYSDAVGRPSHRRGVHTLETLEQSVHIKFTEAYNETRESMRAMLASYLDRMTVDSGNLRVDHVLSLSVSISHQDYWSDRLYWFLLFETTETYYGDTSMFHDIVSTGTSAPRVDRRSENEMKDEI